MAMPNRQCKLLSLITQSTSSPLCLRLLKHLLNNLLLLDQESPGDAVTDAVAASRSTICALNSLLSLRDGGVLAGTESGDLELGKLVSLLSH